MSKERLKKIGIGFLIYFLLCFMLFIFGPSEIFFANVTEFSFIYGDFAGYLAVLAVGGALVLALVTAFLPDVVYRVALSLAFGIAAAGYIQIMFLNRDLDLLGVNPEGYRAKAGTAVWNLVVWILVIAAVLVLSFCKKEIWRKVVAGLAAFLLSIQLVALVSLLLTAKDSAYAREEGSWHLSGEEQFTVSADQNVIVFVLDYFSNQYLEPLLNAYPGATDFLHDFTYYSNMDCVYFGTFPSLPHMLTGQDVDMAMPINDWCYKIWNEESTAQFYDAVKGKNFKVNVYTPDTNILCGLNDVSILEGKLDNVVNTSQEVDINSRLLFKTLIKMSAYRMMPEYVKPSFYANIDEYAGIATVVDNPISHENYQFYQTLSEKGLSVDSKSNYLVVQHLMGPHLYTTDEEGHYKENSTLEETAKGCMVIVEDYINRLKEQGLYDNATIVITADHGGGYDSQVIFYIKKPGESHDSSPVNDAPVSFCEFLPTLADTVGVDASLFGQTIGAFAPGEERERTVWLRWNDPAYPAVPCYTGDKEGSSNVYYGYTYTGDIKDLLEQTQRGPSCVVPVADSYF